MVLAPPSRKPGGDAYSWLNPPGFFDLANPPEWLLGKIAAAAQPKLSEMAMPRMAIDTDLAEIAELLDYVDPEASYTDWVSTLMALHAATGGGADGLDLAVTWSARGQKYKPGEVAAKWGGFKCDGGVAAGTIAAMARLGGADLSSIARRHHKQPSDALAGDFAVLPAGGMTAEPRFEETPFASSWLEPDPRLLRTELPPAPELPLGDVLGPRLAQWVANAAESKGAPADYVFAALLAVAGATIGNARWVSIWQGWAEPPVIWAACIGQPSAGKSPAIDAMLQPLRAAERPLREAAEKQRAEWSEKAAVAALVESAWKETAKSSIKAGDTPPERPKGCAIGPAPHSPRLVVNDGTIERLGAILARQPRGTLQMRDELAGFLEGMQRYSGGGTDRPFWLEAYGGRGFTVERMGREPLTIDRLSIGVVGGIQPDRLKTLLFKSDDDGLLARFLPIWPEPAPLHRPQAWADETLMEAALARLLTLDLVADENDETRPWFVPFTDDARDLMDGFRQAVRGWEGESDGLMLSFIGKLPGLAARLALVLAFLDWATDEAEAPHEITVQHFGRAAHLVEAYFLPMARRAYADAATPKPERAARRLVAVIREQGWHRFTSRDVLRLERAGLRTTADLTPALAALEEGECIRAIENPPNPQGGRPSRLFTVNPPLLGGLK